MPVPLLVSEVHRASLLDLDPDLGVLMAPERLRYAARALTVDVRVFRRGSLPIGRLADASPTNVGLLLLDGVISRELALEDTVSAELLGAGDLLRPWSLAAADELLAADTRWEVLSGQAQMALLDRRLAGELRQFPEIGIALIDRVNTRASRLGTTQAISHLTRVDRRLVALFTHLAERWGRMTADGVVVPLRLSHRMLSQLVGARRPTVSSALSRLGRSGQLLRRTDGTWLVRYPTRSISAGVTSPTVGTVAAASASASAAGG